MGSVRTKEMAVGQQALEIRRRGERRNDFVRDLTLIVPYYRQPKMLALQVAEWNKYSDWPQIILVDDCSPEPALPIVKELASEKTRKNLIVYRTDVDIPWSREFARNLGSKLATTEWLLHVDIDHIVPAASMEQLRDLPLMLPRKFYRFRRMRVGKADETRKKDAIPANCEFGEIHPHVDSYLLRASDYWTAGGYNEKFCGVLGGGNEFLRRLEAKFPSDMVPGDIFLHVHTRSVVDDASDRHCSRDTKPGKDLWRAMNRSGGSQPTEWLTLPWSRVL